MKSNENFPNTSKKKNVLSGCRLLSAWGRSSCLMSTDQAELGLEDCQAEYERALAVHVGSERIVCWDAMPGDMSGSCLFVIRGHGPRAVNSQ